ncbi:MAG: hypothetical protein ACYDDZ_14185 [Acidimicrobiales bacterium]
MRILVAGSLATASLSVIILISPASAAGVSWTAYVANSGSTTVSGIATATNTVPTTFTVGSSPDAIAITPDGKTAYVAK